MKKNNESDPPPAGSLAPFVLTWILALSFQGCVTDEVGLVNRAALAQRISPTDSISRKLALSTMPMIEERDADYRIGADDMLSVSIFEWMLREETKTVEVRVAESGTVTLPLIGTVAATGKTVEEVQEDISKRLIDGGFIKVPRVNVMVKEFRSKSIAVIGALEAPGRYNLRQNVTTLLDALGLAGGLNENAGYVLYVLRPLTGGKQGVDPAGIPAGAEAGAEQTRTPTGTKVDADPSETAADHDLPALPSLVNDGSKEAIVIDLYALLQKGDLDLNMVLAHGDVVYVPEASQFHVVGFVRKPGGFPLRRPTTVLDGIALAEGLMEDEASPRHCALKRKTATGELVIPLDLVAISRGEHPNLYLQSYDIIDVRQTGWKKAALESLDLVKQVFNIGYHMNYDD